MSMYRYPYVVLRNGVRQYSGISRASEKSAQEVAEEMITQIRENGPSTWDPKNPPVDMSEYDVLVGAAAKLWLWSWEYDKLPEKWRDILPVVVPEVFADDALKTKYDVKKTMRIAQARIHIAGLSETCPRCGGTGHYSFNLRDGTRCWGCYGNKWVIRENRRHFAKIKRVFSEINERGGWSVRQKEEVGV